jgi:hypothetical protein
MASVTIKMELSYTQEDFEYATGEKFDTYEAFKETVLEYVEDDIHEYLRGYALDQWCTVIEERNNE